MSFFFLKNLPFDFNGTANLDKVWIEFFLHAYYIDYILDNYGKKIRIY